LSASGSNSRWDVILEDLSMRGRRNAAKPQVSLDVLPELIARRLAPRGVVVVNVLPMPGTSWRVLLKGLAAPFPSALVITLEDYGLGCDSKSIPEPSGDAT
jgi:hypothetical protein